MVVIWGLNKRSHNTPITKVAISSYCGNCMELCEIRSNPIEQGQEHMVLIWGTPIPFPNHMLWRMYGTLRNT